MMPQQELHDRHASASALLRRAQELTVLSALFSYPEPGHAAVTAQRIAGLASPSPHAGSAAHAREPLRAAAARALADRDDEALATEHARLFLGRTPCSLHSAAYGGGGALAGPAPEIADVSGFYHAFGLNLAEHAGERPDHLAIELEFHAALLIKESYALLNGWEDAREITAEAARSFLEAHLGGWQGTLRAALAEAEAAPPYPEAAAWLDALLAAECAARGARPKPFEPARADAAPEEPIECPQSGPAPHGARPLRWMPQG